MHRKLLMLSTTAAFVLLAFAHDSQRPTTTTQPAVAPSTAAGLVVNIDPTTGAIVEQSTPSTTKLAVDADLAARWSTSSEDLIERPNPSGGKGMYINLQGRFENGMVATVTADGKLAAPCAQGLNTAANLAASQK